jgi:DNA adenine methylase
LLKKCKHKWLITYDDSDYIRDLFSFADIPPWSVKYRMRNVSEFGNQTGMEMLISSYLTVLAEQKYSNFLKYVDYGMMNGDAADYGNKT